MQSLEQQGAHQMPDALLGMVQMEDVAGQRVLAVWRRGRWLHRAHGRQHAVVQASALDRDLGCTLLQAAGTQQQITGRAHQQAVAWQEVACRCAGVCAVYGVWSGRHRYRLLLVPG
jgi:hypothetical protein